MEHVELFVLNKTVFLKHYNIHDVTQQLKKNDIYIVSIEIIGVRYGTEKFPFMVKQFKNTVLISALYCNPILRLLNNSNCLIAVVWWQLISRRRIIIGIWEGSKTTRCANELKSSLLQIVRGHRKERKYEGIRTRTTVRPAITCSTMLKNLQILIVFLLIFESFHNFGQPATCQKSISFATLSNIAS